MSAPRTVDECKKILFKLGMKHGVSPKLISERLLSSEDKEDMLQGLISLETLDCAIRVWMYYGMCNYANGSGMQYEDYRAYLSKGGRV